MRKNLIVVVVFSVVFQLTVAAQVDSALEQAGEARNAAREAGDGEAWGSYTADDFVVIGGDGSLLTKAQRIAAIEQGQGTEPGAERETSIRTYGDTAIVTASGPQDWITTTWVRTNGRWLATHVQFTPISEP